MIQKLIIKNKLIDLNTYINTERGNRYAAAKIKKDLTEYIYYECKAQKLLPFKKPVRIKYIWYVSSRRWDGDNISFGKKFIHDGLQMAGIIPKDNLLWIVGFDSEEFIVTTKRSGVDVIITDRVKNRSELG